MPSVNKRQDVVNELRKLWEQHVMWTRSFIISSVENLQDIDFVTKRLLRNPNDFAKFLRRYYGDRTASEFQKLLEEHLLLASRLVKAILSEDTREAIVVRELWYDNADKIAEFLTKLNPHSTYRQWQQMMYDHLKLLEDELMARLGKRYGIDVQKYDIIEEQALMMADMMAEGIIREFRL